MAAGVGTLAAFVYPKMHRYASVHTAGGISVAVQCPQTVGHRTIVWSCCKLQLSSYDDVSHNFYFKLRFESGFLKKLIICFNVSSQVNTTESSSVDGICVF